MSLTARKEGWARDGRPLAARRRVVVCAASRPRRIGRAQKGAEIGIVANSRTPLRWAMIARRPRAGAGSGTGQQRRGGLPDRLRGADRPAMGRYVAAERDELRARDPGCSSRYARRARGRDRQRLVHRREAAVDGDAELLRDEGGGSLALTPFAIGMRRTGSAERCYTGPTGRAWVPREAATAGERTGKTARRCGGGRGRAASWEACPGSRRRSCRDSVLCSPLAPM